MNRLFFAVLILDIIWTICVVSFFWDFDGYRSTFLLYWTSHQVRWLNKAEQNGCHLGLYAVLISISIIRIVSGFLMARTLSRSKVFGYLIPSAICILLGTIDYSVFHSRVTFITVVATATVEWKVPYRWGSLLY